MIFFRACLTASLLLFLSGAAYSEFESEISAAMETAEKIRREYPSPRPLMLGENLPGVLNRIDTDKKILALTLDACGGKNGGGADENLIDFLIEKGVKATIFVNARWIAENRELFFKIAFNPLFEVENHGMEHRPLTVRRKRIYSIAGAGSPERAAYEVEAAGRIMEKLTGRKPRFFRAGTAYYDEIGLSIANALGYGVVGYSLSADRGATLPADKVAERLASARSGDIIIAHMNRPSSGTGDGIAAGLPKLLEEGYEFVKLSEVALTHAEINPE